MRRTVPQHQRIWPIFYSLVVMTILGAVITVPSHSKTSAASRGVDGFVPPTLGEGNTITVKKTGASYKVVKEKPTTGQFHTQQKADIVLSAIDFNKSGGSRLFNHPGSVASDGEHLLLADRNNNRVLIWNTLPKGNKRPDIVLGQKNFITNHPGSKRGEMNWPVSVAVADGKVVVADTNNYRILIWTSFPTANGQPADLVLNDGSTSVSDNPTRNIRWPWDVWTNGKKLVITSTGGAYVLIWNTFPKKNDQDADMYLTADGLFGTPRAITTDGDRLIVGDHNAKVGDSSESGNFFWKHWPTENDQPHDFYMVNPTDTGQGLMHGDFTKKGKLLMKGGKALHTWNSFPEGQYDRPDLTVTFNPGESPSADSSNYFGGGDGSNVDVVNGRIYISSSNANKIVGFESLPTTEDEVPDFFIGSRRLRRNSLDSHFFITNPVPATDGESLFVSSDFDQRLYVWKKIPDESGAYPDFVYALPEGVWDNEIFGDTLALSGKQIVYIWEGLPRNGELPDTIFSGSIGNVTFQKVGGVALDDKYFYLADGGANKIYVWEGIPTEDSDPKFTISTDQPTRLSSDGTYLVVTATLSNHEIRIFRIADLSDDAEPIAAVGGAGVFNLPEGALAAHGRLFVADTGSQRVLIWNNIEDAINGKDANASLGMKCRGERRACIENKSIEERSAKIGRKNLFWPSTLAFDGSFLWVGEYKFSGRLLRFSVK